MSDWMAALDRLKQGMQNPEGQTMREMRWSDYTVGQETPEAFWSRGKQRDVEAVPFGSLADPVSQLAFLLAPQILPALKGLRASGAMPTGSVLGNQRGAVGGGGFDELKRLTEARGGKGPGGATPRPRDLFAPATREPYGDVQALRSLYGRYVQDDLARYSHVHGGVNDALKYMQQRLPTMSEAELHQVGDLLHEHGSDWQLIVQQMQTTRAAAPGP